MDNKTQLALSALNRRFYDARGRAFSAKRSRPWAGWEPILERLRPDANVLDLGCGHGRLAMALAARCPDFRYLGIDGSHTMLQLAQVSASAHVRFRQADLVAIRLPDLVPETDFDLVAVLAVLHHIPGSSCRATLVADALSRVRPGGLLAISLWHFVERPRLADARVSTTAHLGRHAEALEVGDHLLGFDGSSACPRYCHAPDERERQQLAALPGATLEARYRPARGDTLNEYFLFRAG